MKNSKIIISIFLCVVLTVCTFPLTAYAADNSIVADWSFDKDSVKSGSIKENNLVIADKSNNGNDLVLDGKDADKYLQFSDDTMYDNTSGSLNFNNEKSRLLGKGVEFVTADNAPINKNNFENGYTIELIYKLADDFSADDAWMGLMARKGKSKNQIETKKCTMSLAVSNCKELQFRTASKDDDEVMEDTWSVTMDKGGLWYHIVIASDGNTIATYVNGCESFRDYECDNYIGMFADPNDGRFVIGGLGNGIYNHYARGAIQQIRISDKALNKSEWLISDHEKYIEKFGENLPFTNLSSSSYNMVFLPDIQNAVEFCPEILNTATKWLSDNKETVNPVSYISLGDSVNTFDDLTQWDTAIDFYKELEKEQFPILQQPGNHDYGDEYYLNAFGPDSDFGKRQTDRGIMYSPSGYSSYMTFDGGSYRYLVVNISMMHIEDNAERKWFEDVLKNHKDYPAIVTSHSFQDVDDAIPNVVKLNDFGKSIWDIVKKYDNVFIMFSGHNHGAGEEVLLNDSGNEVYSIMTDYQFTYNGGNAFFRFAEFDEAHNKIRLSSFSPYSATLQQSQRTFFDVNYMTGKGNYTVIDFDFSARFSGLRTSENNSEYQAVLQSARENEKNAPISLFEDTEIVSKAQAHEISNDFAITPLTIALTAGAILTVLIAITAITIVAVKRKNQK